MVKVAMILAASFWASAAGAQSVTLTGLDGQSKTINAADLGAMPRETVTLRTEGGQTIRYEGVSLDYLLAGVGAPQGGALRGREMADIVIVSAKDGYRVVLALSDVDPALREEKVILADSADGAPLGPHDGPFRLVVEGDRRAARSERMVTAIALARAPAP